MNRIKIYIYFSLLAILLTGCSMKEENDRIVDIVDKIDYSDTEIMEGMNHLYSWNENGSYLDIRGKEEDELYVLLPEDQVLQFEIENGGDHYRELAIRVYIDYKQVPIEIDGKSYNTYIIKTDENISIQKDFKILAEIDKLKNHKITVILTTEADKYYGDGNLLRELGANSIGVDGFLVCNKDASLYTHEEEYEEVRKYADEFTGICITEDMEGNKKLPTNIYTQSGNPINLSYHIGGYKETEEMIVLLESGMEQCEINGKPYLAVECEDGMVSWGDFEFKVPDEIGKYEMIGWIIEEPYEMKNCKWSVMLSTFRFTLNVE